jgi:phosphopantothenoylcysteine decarboxylase/phosphopantothenate--cysteine ligase
MGSKIVIGVTGGIAAYKMANLCSKLKQSGHELRVMMTKSATEFITPLTFQALTSNKVIVDMFEHSEAGVNHIEWADWADCVVIAPATANIIGKISNGIADDFVTTIVMATKAPVILAPAMNVNMFNNPIVQKNIDFLEEIGYSIVEPEEGYLACGYSGKGRLATDDSIVSMIEAVLDHRRNYANSQNDYNLKLTGKKILITAGPTREAIDPVRFLSNHSSGKMGYAIARVARDAGAQVTLISGPTSIEPPVGVQLINVITAKEMLNEVLTNLPEQDIIIKAAAVADYRPVIISEHKIKKTNDIMTIELQKNDDILLAIADNKLPHQLVIGFAAESENLLENARIKLTNKQLDLIVANDISKSDVGFNVDDNEVCILNKDGVVARIEKTSKNNIAFKILKEINKLSINDEY